MAGCQWNKLKGQPETTNALETEEEEERGIVSRSRGMSAESWQRGVEPPGFTREGAVQLMNILPHRTLLTTEGFNLEAFHNFTDNLTFAYDDDPSAPCSVAVPGFNSLGLTVTYMAVFVLGAVGNGVVVYVVCSMKKGRGSTDTYLMHLAMADLLFCLTLPFWAVNAHSGWLFGNFLCKLLSAFQEASVYSSVFLLACISVDRHSAIVRATRARPSHRLLVKGACALVWLVAGVLSLPVAIQKESMRAEDLGRYICHENLTGESGDRWRVGVRVLRHAAGFFLPLAVMAVCYGWIVATLWRARNQQKHKAVRVVLAVVLAFVLCWLPYNVTVLIDTLQRGEALAAETCETRYIVEATLDVTQVLAFAHCAVNPVLYAFIGEKFRNQLLSSLYRHGLMGQRLRAAYRTGSASSAGSFRSRNTSTM
ncbi:C-X-C chemokine receptor type 2 [Liparis tanakae]|uniref:C-X-C chemokine receptor type 2 n=1 Tax=Liparis tanakae TaxID=230148 RepID=A0A4Z2IN42_9TELE|nr:C-X-C chemokine receptor type 2 [Liparis tanakae]